MESRDTFVGGSSYPPCRWFRGSKETGPRWVIRRVGGLEDSLLKSFKFLSVIRRVGGLEAYQKAWLEDDSVIRRVGGLEAARCGLRTPLRVIRRVGGLEGVQAGGSGNLLVIRRVGGLKMFHHAHFSRSSAILPPGHWLLIQYMTSANSLRLKMREKRRSPALTLCRFCG